MSNADMHYEFNHFKLDTFTTHQSHLSFFFVSCIVQIHHALTHGLIAGTTSEKKQLTSFLHCKQMKNDTIHLLSGVNAMSFGAVVSTLELHQLEVISASGADFNLHTAFLCTSEDTEYITRDDPDNETN